MQQGRVFFLAVLLYGGTLQKKKLYFLMLRDKMQDSVWNTEEGGAMVEQEKIVIGLSGGVDSAVAAYLLQEQGYEVIGVTMQVWHGEDAASCATIDQMIADARCVAEYLHIEHHVVNFEAEFEQYVKQPFVEDYFAGRTPNPCVRCNRRVKWEALLQRAEEFGARKVATGHYARIVQTPEGRYTISMAESADKDQTYVLHNLTQEQLARTVMPLGSYTKEEVRAIAADLGMEIAHKADSQEICFIPDDDHVGYLERHHTGELPEGGNFVSVDGTVLGKHQGIWRYTVGQRKGLGIALGKPAYVVALRPQTNEVVLGDNTDVFAPALTVREVVYMGLEQVMEPLRAIGRIRYAHRGAECTIVPIGDGRLRVAFDESQRAITPGQSFVAYTDGYVLLGGIIDTVEGGK